MARRKKFRGPGASAPDVGQSPEGQEGDRIDDASREAGGRRIEAEADVNGADWRAVAECLAKLEAPGNPVTQVQFPGHAPALWGGVYGTAKVTNGELLAITSDGRRHKL